MSSPRTTITVGIDGSEQSDEAMGWAFEQARRNGADVRLLHVAFDYAYKDFIDTAMRDQFAAAAQSVVDTARDRVPADLVHRVTASWSWGAAARVLVEESAGAQLVVVGTRGRTGVGTALGSVSHHVARHAHCSVAVVRPPLKAGQRVLVGVDPATPEPALPVAFGEAASRGLPLTVLRAWHVPPIAGPGLGVPGAGYDLDELHRAEEHVTRQLVEPWAVKFPDVQLQIQLVRGHPAELLVEASYRGDLVVVGSHGRGWFSGLLLGSTGSNVAAHAHCPVLIAR